MISFKAHLISPTTVLEKNENGFTDKKVSFVELEPVSRNDYNTLSNICADWGYTLANDILEDFDRYYEYKSLYEGVYKDSRFFALTTQKTKFSNLKHKNILGVCEVTEMFNNTYNIDYLQTSPQYKASFQNRKIKHVGESLVKSIIALFSNKNIYLEYPMGLKEFYIKMGFKLLRNNEAVLRRVVKK